MASLLSLRRSSLALVGVGLAAVSVGTVVVATDSFADEPVRKPIESVEEAPPPPALSFQFLSSEGQFRVPLWDDRNLSDAQKAEDPSINPAWEPFGACLEAQGVSVEASGSEQFTQQDLDAVLAKVNEEHPDLARNKLITAQGVDRAEGSARVFLECAQEWLTKSPEEIYAITGVPNDWYPPKTD